MSIFFNVLLGIILGLDAFSLFVSLGAFGFNIKRTRLLIIFIGIFHFIFPMLGSILGSFIHIPITELKILVYFFLLIELSIDYYKENPFHIIESIINYFILAFSVSIDSFSIGISLLLNNKLLFSGFIFSSFAMIFSVVGLYIGNHLYKSIGKSAKLIGIILMIIVLLCQIMNA